MPLVIAFAALAAAALLLTKGITNASAKDILTGNAGTILRQDEANAASSSSTGAGPGSTSTSSVGAAISSAGYTNPLSHVLTWERTDQGVDATLPVGAPIVAPGKVKILGIEPNWYAGQPFVYFKLLDGPAAGTIQYVAEQIDDIAPVGTIVQQGQAIAKYAASGSGIEYGYATSSGQTLAAATTGYTEGYATAAGNKMRQWLNSLGAGAGTGAGLSIGAGPDLDDRAAAVAHELEDAANAITTPGYTL